MGLCHLHAADTFIFPGYISIEYHHDDGVALIVEDISANLIAFAQCLGHIRHEELDYHPSVLDLHGLFGCQSVVKKFCNIAL